MSYQEEIKAWLGDYKANHFKHLKNGIWKYRGKEIPCAHILPKENLYYNLLLEYQSELKKYIETNKVKLHQYFYHLNSSQAMCLNFFYPLIKEEKLQLILDFLNIHDTVDYNSVYFEKESLIERQKGYRPTSFDFYFKTLTNKEIHFEIKYTEQDFGRAINDVDHLRKYDLVYQNQCSVINSEYSNCKDFLNYYQLLRNVIHVSDNSYVVFLFPENNKKVKQQAEFAKTILVKPDFQQQVINRTWESLLDFIDTINLNSQRLTKNMDDFKKKYKINCNSAINV